MSDLLVFSLIQELDGSWHSQGAKPLLEVCARLLQAPTADADRAGEPLRVVAHDDGEKIDFVIHGVESDRNFGSITLADLEWDDQSHRDDFVIAYAATLRIALNGFTRATVADEDALVKLWEFSF